MRHNNIKYALFLVLAATSVACDKYLDVLPDKRMELSSKEDVTKLLVSAYPTVSSAFLMETYSDNVDENIDPSWTAYNKLQQEIWEWSDIKAIDSESPQTLWNGYYSAIANANEAIDFIEKNGGAKGAMSAQLGEALACRAFNMFKLYEVFCMAYDPATASKNLGVPYPLKPETTVGQEYDRETVEETFRKIEADILAAVPIISDDYSAAKYHFTPEALYAFASRFYLHYRKFDKVIEFASLVLGDNPASKLRDWAAWRKLPVNDDSQPIAYIKATESANILLLPTYSERAVLQGAYLVGTKYRHSVLGAAEVMDASGPWGASNGILGFYKFYSSVLPGPVNNNLYYGFEMVDPVAGTGYPHSVITEFTMEETLMERAEAYALKGDYENAVKDINELLKKYRVDGKTVVYSVQDIVNYYSKLNFYTDDVPTLRKKLNSTLVTDETTQEPVLQCILYLQRLLTLHNGNRLQINKRYGMEILRRSLDKTFKILAIKDRMKADDPRYAVQLPQDVISGIGKTKPLPKNPR